MAIVLCTWVHTYDTMWLSEVVAIVATFSIISSRADLINYLFLVFVVRLSKFIQLRPANSTLGVDVGGNEIRNHLMAPC